MQGCEAIVKDEGDIEILVGDVERTTIGTDLDPIYLSIFAHR